MNRRDVILKLLIEASTAITGTELARRLGVSRQVIVQDMALLRAHGHEVLSTPHGYRLPPATDKWVRDVLAVRHPPELTELELNTLVDCGVRVVDVLVEHPLYGELQGYLMLENRSDVHTFLERVAETQAPLLLTLTDGFHLHSVEAKSQSQIDRAKQALADLGILYKAAYPLDA